MMKDDGKKHRKLPILNHYTCIIQSFKSRQRWGQISIFLNSLKAEVLARIKAVERLEQEPIDLEKLPDLPDLSALEGSKKSPAKKVSQKGSEKSQQEKVPVKAQNPVPKNSPQKLPAPVPMKLPSHIIPDSEEHLLKLMECNNARKAEKRASMGLPSLTPYFCKDFDTKECFFR